MMESTYSVSSLVGLVSSKRRWQREFGAYSCGEAEVQADGLGVADVQVAIRLRREPRDDHAAVLPCLHIGGDDLTDEVEAGRRGVVGGRMGHGSIESRDECRFKVQSRSFRIGVRSSGGRLLQAGYQERAKRTRFGLSASRSGKKCAKRTRFSGSEDGVGGQGGDGVQSLWGKRGGDGGRERFTLNRL